MKFHATLTHSSESCPGPRGGPPVTDWPARATEVGIELISAVQCQMSHSQYFVVETDDFADRPDNYRWSSTWRTPTSTLHMVERFTRTDAETIDYQVTITDPSRFTRPWTARFPLSTDQAGRGVAAGKLFEFACHEGNYALSNILSGARYQERLEAQNQN